MTLDDTFPPAAPEKLIGGGARGRDQPDLGSEQRKRSRRLPRAARHVAGDSSRGEPAPIADTNFKDTVPSGVRYTYAVVAVDKHGNKSAPSNTVDETARD